MVAQRICSFGRFTGGLQQAVAEPLAREQGFRRASAERRHADRAERDARFAAALAVRPRVTIAAAATA